MTSLLASLSIDMNLGFWCEIHVWNTTHVSQPTPVADFKWTDLQTEGVTDLGRALAMVAEQLRIPPMSDRALPPVLVLISDGQPTDDFNQGLQTLLNEPWGKKAVRIAIAIGEDADTEVLQKFIGHPELKPLQANNPETPGAAHQMGVHRRAEIRLLPGQSGGGRDSGPQRADSHAAGRCGSQFGGRCVVARR